MKDIIDNIKTEIKDKKAELARLEAALLKLEPEKAVPKAARTRASGTTETSGGSASTATRSVDSLPDRIAALLAPDASGTWRFPHGLKADDIAEELGAPVSQVRTTCSRLAREGRLTTNKLGKSMHYLGLKSEAPKADANPFAEGAN